MPVHYLKAFYRRNIGDVVKKGFKIPPADLFGVLYPQTTGRRIPRIGQRRQILLGQRVVIFFETILVHQYFPADLHELYAIAGKSGGQRHRPYLFDIGRYLVTRDTVPPRNPPQQPVILIGQGNTGAVKFGFDTIFQLFQPRELPNLTAPEFP